MNPETLQSLRVAPGCRVSVFFVLTQEDGEVLHMDRAEPTVYVHGAGELPPALERALEGAAPGDVRSGTLTAEEGFANELVQCVLPEDHTCKVGDELVHTSQDGWERVGVAVQVDGPRVIVDFPHPLHGKALHYEARVVGVEAPAGAGAP